MKKIVSLLLSVVLLLGLVACGNTATESSTPAESEELVETNVFVLSGPTGIGAANLKNKADKGETKGNYNITVVAQPTEVVAKISKGEADIAAVATNLASNIYNKTKHTRSLPEKSAGTKTNSVSSPSLLSHENPSSFLSILYPFYSFAHNQTEHDGKCSGQVLFQAFAEAFLFIFYLARYASYALWYRATASSIP